MKERSQFLHAPRDQKDEVLRPAAKRLLAKANALLDHRFKPSINPYRRDLLLLEEARHSAAIESEYKEARVKSHLEALGRFLAKDRNPSALFEMHRDMFHDQEHAQPGTYRTVQVRIADYFPPAPALVPSLMDEFFFYVNQPGKDAVAHAAWAHIQFETIHPFADGNGRTGRAFIQHILGVPLPISVTILARRNEYYRLLNSGEWKEYLEWFADIVIKAAERIR